MTGGPARDLAAIVLAGGRSSRFGRDKLAEPLAGRPLLEHALLAVGRLAGTIVVVGDAGPATLSPPAGATLARVPDERPGGGPLAALATGLRAVRSHRAIVVAGDMPELEPAVLVSLVEALATEPDADVAVLVHGGRRLPLPSAMRVEAGARAAEAALAGGESSLRALLGRLRVRAVEEPAWRELDPPGGSVRDIDDVAGLAETERRPRFRRASCGG